MAQGISICSKWTKSLEEKPQRFRNSLSLISVSATLEFRRHGALDEKELRARLDRHGRALASAAGSLGLDLPKLLADLAGPDEAFPSPDEESPASLRGCGG